MNRLSTIAGADNIIVMSKGRIAEQGTHAELLKRGSIYSDMVRQQSVQSTLEGGTSNGIPSKSELDEKASSKQLQIAGGITERAVTMPEQAKESSSIWSLVRFVYSLNREDGVLIFLGLLSSVVAGASHPA